MIANYFIIDDLSLKQIEKMTYESLLDKIEQMLDDDVVYPCCDIDTIWQGLYFLISSKKEPVFDKNDFDIFAKSSFIFGNNILSEKDFISFVKKDDINHILKQIEKIDLKNIEFLPKVFDENKIYPNMWLKEHKEILFEEMEMAFDELKSFFEKANRQNKNILVTIM